MESRLFRYGFRGLVALALAAAATAPGEAFEARVMDSVVSVLPLWPARPDDPEEPEGSGVAILPGGYVATNVHVLGSAREVEVRLADGRVLPAEIVGRDPPTDIALIRVAEPLPVLDPAPEPALADPVCAVGNQFGLGLSVTCGVVSALHRTGTGFNPVEDFVQTDATVNPGGSGGALVDAEGRLVGLLSAIFTKRSDADIGINFAASTALVLRVVEDLRAYGRVRRGRTGLRVAPLEGTARRTVVGARVVAVRDAAADAGLAPGDIILRVGERAIRRPEDVTSAFALHRVGDRVPVVYRRDRASATTVLELGG